MLAEVLWYSFHDAHGPTHDSYIGQLMIPFASLYHSLHSTLCINWHPQEIGENQIAKVFKIVWSNKINIAIAMATLDEGDSHDQNPAIGLLVLD